MKLFFEQEQKIPKLTTIECLNMLEEERHHTDFLDLLKDEIYQFILGKIKQMMAVNSYSHSVIFNSNTRYFNQLIIKIDLNQKPDFSNPKQNGGQYYSEEKMIDGKLYLPKLDLKVGIGLNGEIADKWLRIIVDHEINHLYDDWQWQSTGHEPLTNETQWNHGDGLFIQQNLGNKADPLIMSIAWSVYASLWTESNSYVNQAFKEFEHVKMKPANVHKKIKSTTSYRNFSKQLIDMKWYVSQEKEEDLKQKVLYLFKKYGKLSVPKPKNESNYKDRLIKWSEGIYNKFMKRYCGIASLYLDRNFNKFIK